ncbi:MAG: chorismate synthase [Treponema sp.]|nr:chorismate synthase [Treponema sp.]
MSRNSFGKNFTVTTFGESHGDGLGCIVDGCPSNIKIDSKKIQAALNRRRPGNHNPEEKNNTCVTSRKEADLVEILSGIKDGLTLGTPISMIIKNTSQHSQDYGNLEYTYRPGHADYTYDKKFGFRDYRGGGRSSGRETAARVAAGAIATAILEEKGISLKAYTIRAAGIKVNHINYDEIEQNPLRAADSEAASRMQAKIEEIRKQGDSAGAVIECCIKGVPAGLGEPVFDKLDAMLSHAMLSIGAVKGIEFGSGFEASDMTGSMNNDAMRTDGKNVFFSTNNAGGILGGISNGNDIVFRVAVKPVPSIYIKQQTVSKTKTGYENTDLEIKGRHDVCLAPRIVPVVEAMAAITLADALLSF